MPFKKYDFLKIKAYLTPFFFLKIILIDISNLQKNISILSVTTPLKKKKKFPKSGSVMNEWNNGGKRHLIFLQDFASTKWT